LSAPGDSAPGFVGAPRLWLKGRVVPLDGGGVVLDGERIAAVAGVPGLNGSLSAQATAGPAHEYPTGTLLPGLIDAHVHLCLAHGEDLGPVPDEELVAACAEIGRTAAIAMLAAGVTSARDLGCRACSAQRVRDGLSADSRPSLVVAGRPITVAGGHFASFGLAMRGSADGRRAVDELVDEDVDLIKVMLTGGTLTPGTALGLAQLDLEELKAVTDRSHQLARRVAAHAHGTAGIEIAVAAGVDTIEHCGFLDLDGRPGPIDERLVEQMAERGQVVVIAAPMPSGMVDTDADTARSAGALDPARVASLQLAWHNAASLRRAGVRVALGSDSFFGQFSDYRDLIYRAEAIVKLGGWAPCDVLGLLTEGGAAALGRAKEIGRLGPGAMADLVVVDGDPSEDITVLRRVLAVYRSGRLVSK
jgi:imidazolonepropionase-like amidohydrolase